MVADEPEEPDVPQPNELYEWRKLRDDHILDPWTGVLASLEIDMHELKRMLGHGATHQQVLRIVL